MADVPAWVLVFNTAAVGGFGLLGAFIVPKAQREARAAEKEEKAHAIMRDKAEQIFSSINAAREINNAALLRGMSILRDKSLDTGAYDVTVFRLLDPIAGLVATYYPGGMEVIRKGRQAMRVVTDPLNARITSTPDPASDGSIVLRVQMVTAVAGENTKILDGLESFIMAAVVPYVPAKASVT